MDPPTLICKKHKGDEKPEDDCHVLLSNLTARQPGLLHTNTN